jgi:hypothetical protein
MKLLITGSRSYPSGGLIKTMLYGAVFMMNELGEPLEVIHGAAPDGVDWYVHEMLETLRQHRMPRVSETPVPADWDGPCDFESGMCQQGHRRPSRFGSSLDFCPTAGHRRNQVMVDMHPERWWAFTDRPLQLSKGTADCVARCKKAGIQGNHMELWTP